MRCGQSCASVKSDRVTANCDLTATQRCLCAQRCYRRNAHLRFELGGRRLLCANHGEHPLVDVGDAEERPVDQPWQTGRPQLVRFERLSAGFRQTVQLTRLLSGRVGAPGEVGY